VSRTTGHGRRDLAYAVALVQHHFGALSLQVERQIEQMVRFIKQEAEEKANEIKVSAEEVRGPGVWAARVWYDAHPCMKDQTSVLA